MNAVKTSRETGNRILDRLLVAEVEYLLNESRLIDFKPRDEIDRIGAPTAAVYFPISGVYSLQLPLQDGQTIEVGVVDHAGLIGIPAILGYDQNPFRTVAIVPGQCVRVTATRFARILSDCGPLDTLVRRFLGYSWHAANQNLACGLRHPIRMRICRWLLVLHDRAADSEFKLTHESLAQMVNASRQKVTTVAGRLQDEGLIRYQRGLVRITSRRGLEAASCECYNVLRDSHEQLFD